MSHGNFTASTDSPERLVFDHTQNIQELHTHGKKFQDDLNIPEAEEQLVFDATQDFNETQTYVPTMTMDDHGFESE